MGDTLIFAVGLDEHRCVSLAFSPGGTLLAAGRSNGMVGLWQVGTGRLLRHFLHDLLGHPVRAVAFSADGALLAAAGGGHLALRDLRTGRLVWKRQHPAELTAVAFGPAGDCVTTACADGTLRTWTLRGRLATEVAGGCGRTTSRIEHGPAGPTAHDDGDEVRAVAQNGRLVAEVDGDELRVWVADAVT